MCYSSQAIGISGKAQTQDTPKTISFLQAILISVSKV